MDRLKISVVLLPALLLLACEPSQVPHRKAESDTTAPNAASIVTDANMAAPVATAAADDAPAPPLPALTPEAERGVKGARNILLGFARDIEQRDFAAAWALLGPADRQKWSRPAFAAMFADLREISVAITDGTTEGAAGSIYYTAPVTITAADKDGRPVRLEGSAVLRRVNDVDGATPAQLRWHFDTLTLDWTH